MRKSFEVNRDSGRGIHCNVFEPRESQGRTAMSNVRATVWCHGGPVIMFILGKTHTHLNAPTGGLDGARYH